MKMRCKHIDEDAEVDEIEDDGGDMKMEIEMGRNMGKLS